MAVWTPQITGNLIFLNQIMTTFMCGFPWVIQIRPFEAQPQRESRPAPSVGIDVHQTVLIQSVYRSRSRHNLTTPGSDSASTCSSATKRQPSPHKEPSLPHTFSFSFFPHPSFASRFACFHCTDTLKWNFIGLRSHLWPPCHCLLPYSEAYVGPFRAVTGSHWSQILQNSVNSYNKKIRSRKKSEVSTTVTVLHQASVPVNESSFCVALSSKSIV